MKLEIFEFLDGAVNHVYNNIDFVNNSANSIRKFFKDIFLNSDFYINTQARVKSEDSIREKFLRNNYYYIYPNSIEAIRNLPDLIGVRIECRFMDDEKKIFDVICDNFTIKCENGFYKSELNSNIELKLSEKQPMIQKNGFEIYKVDGRFVDGEDVINFELQIKSLVNVFWGEIDHTVLYKNFNYMITEDFIRAIMFSIKANLSMVDNQLQSVYNHLKNVENKSNFDSSKIQLKAIVSKMVHDLYSVKIKESTGFVVDFKDCADIIVDYIFSKNKFQDAMNYEDYFMRFLNRLNGVSSRKILIGETVEFLEEVEFKNDLCKKFGEGLVELVNKDFKWNLIISVIRDIEENPAFEELVTFVDFVVFAVVRRVKKVIDVLDISSDDKNDLKWKVSYIIIDYLSKTYSPSLLTYKSMKEVENKLREFFSVVERPEDIMSLDFERLYDVLDNRFRKIDEDVDNI